MEEKEGGSSFFIGFLVGVLAGAAIGILYAPKPGRETRAMLKEKATELKDKASDMISRVKKKDEE